MITADRDHCIREAAYYKWHEHGCPDGDGLEFWLAAEREYDETATCAQADEAVLEASQESFPASDPPAWTGTAASAQEHD